MEGDRQVDDPLWDPHPLNKKDAASGKRKISTLTAKWKVTVKWVEKGRTSSKAYLKAGP